MARRARKPRISPEVEAARIAAEATEAGATRQAVATSRAALISASAAIVAAVVAGVVTVADGGNFAASSGQPIATDVRAPQRPSSGVTLSARDIELLHRAAEPFDRRNMQRLYEGCESMKSAQGRACLSWRLDLLQDQIRAADLLKEQLRHQGIAIVG